MSLNEQMARTGRYLYSVRQGEMTRYKFARGVARLMRRSADEICDAQLRDLRRIVDHAFEHSTFYNRRFNEAGYRKGDLKDYSDLRNLPELTRTDLRDFLEEIVCREISKNELLRDATGGTSGIPLDFYRDSFCLNYRRGIDLALSRHYGWRDGQWQGWLWGASRDVVRPRGIKGWIKKNWIDRAYFLDVSRMGRSAYEDFVEETKRARPTYVAAYPSIAYDLSLRMESGEVSRVRVPLVSVSAEPLYEFQRKKIESAFADRVLSRYSVREFGTAAFECHQQDGMHIFADSVYLETVPLEGCKSNSGALLVTDLLNFTMPLIRYRVGDAARVDYSPCKCGLSLPKLKDVQGREADIIWRPDGTGFPGPHMVNLVGLSGIKAPVQIVQDRLDQVAIRVQGSLFEHQAEIEKLKALFTEEIGSDLIYRAESTESIERLPSGKYKYVVSNVRRPEQRIDRVDL